MSINITVGSGSNPMAGILQVPVANINISSKVIADSPSRPKMPESV